MRVARGVPPGDDVPQQFVQRVRAAIRRAEPDPTLAWSAGLWRGALCAVAVAAVAGAVWGPARVSPVEIPDTYETELADASLPDVSEIDPGASW